MSWSALPGTKEPAELIEERKRTREAEKAQEAAERAVEDNASAAAAHASVAAAAAAAAATAAAVARPDAEARRRAAEDTHLAGLARNPGGGYWHVPDARDAWQWSRGGWTSQELDMELGGNFMPNRMVALRREDDSWRVVVSSLAPGGGHEYGEPLRGETLNRRAGVRPGEGAATTGLGLGLPVGSTAVVKRQSGGISSVVEDEVAAAKRESDEEVHAWFDRATAHVSVLPPPRPSQLPPQPVGRQADTNAAVHDKDRDAVPAEVAQLLAAARAEAGAAGASGGETQLAAWFRDFTKDVEVPTVRLQTSLGITGGPANAGAGTGARAVAGGAEGANTTKIEGRTATRVTEEATEEEAKDRATAPIIMRPSASQSAASARLMGEVFDAIMKSRKRLFYDLVVQPLDDWDRAEGR